MAHTRRTIVLGLLGIGIVGGLLFVSLRPEPIPVDAHTVERGRLVVTVDVDGVTRVADLYDISAPIGGVAQRAPVAVGDPVVAHETVVAQVQPSSPELLDARTRLQLEAAVREAEAAVLVADTEQVRVSEAQAYALAQYNRTQTLVERGVASISALEDAHQALAVANAALVAANARILQAQGGLDWAEAALVDVSDSDSDLACCIDILSPADGVVLTIDTISERPVTAGTRLLTVGDPQALEIVADLLSSDAIRLSPGAPATVERWGGAPLEARMLRVEPTARTEVSALGIEEQRVDVVLEFTSPLEARAGLGHGFSVFLRVVEAAVDDAVLVPLSATFRSGGDWAVFEVRGDRVAQVPVELGLRNARFVEVISGLAPGAKVVTHPNTALSDGALIVERTTF